MIFSIDLWHRDRGFGFSLMVREEIEDLGKVNLFEWQIKLFGKDWGTGDAEEHYQRRL